MTQQVLQIKFDPRNTPRPTTQNECIVRAGLISIAEDVVKWQGHGTVDEVIDDLMDAWDRVLDGDGFALAHELQSWHGWTCNAELVEILDATDYAIDCALEHHVKEWAKLADVTLPKVGDRVSVPVRGKRVNGEVIRLWPDTATCVVRGAEHSIHEGWVINAEDVLPCE
jgi:hypothetical protein